MFPNATSTNNTSATNSRLIPTVEAASRRPTPNPRSNTSALERKLDEALNKLDNVERSNEEYKAKLDRVAAECEELKFRLDNKPADETKYGFPGSKDELEQFRVNINI